MDATEYWLGPCVCTPELVTEGVHGEKYGKTAESQCGGDVHFFELDRAVVSIKWKQARVGDAEAMGMPSIGIFPSIHGCDHIFTGEIKRG